MKLKTAIGRHIMLYTFVLKPIMHVRQVPIFLTPRFICRQIHLLSTADKRDSLQKKMEHAEENLGNLRAVALGYFDIGLATTATIGTINSYRLGTLSQEPVEWWEINTAWGVAVLLLDRLRIEVLAPLHAKHKKHFWIDDVGSVSWKPRGSYPRVTVVPTSTMTPTIHELVGPVSKIICPGYDKALVLFVKSLNAVGNALGNADEHAALPYPIEGDRVGGLSVRYGFSRDVTWTSALRHVLANLEWCLSRLRMKC
jgi:beclin 1